MPESLSQVKSALSVMYSNASQNEKMQTTKMLESFQKSPQAWETVHQILNDDSESTELKLFAAQTLRSKITYDLHQIDADLSQVKDSMLSILLKYSDHSKRLIRTQMCIALSQLALQYLAWSDAFDEIVSKLQNSVPCLLEFLKILPEELSDIKKSPLSDEDFNSRTTQIITNNVRQTLMLLNNLAQSSSEFNQQILDSLNSWIKECPIESVLEVDSLTTLIFLSLTQDDTFDQLIECLCTIMRETRDIENYKLIDALYQQIIQLNIYMSSHPEKLQDPDTVNGLTRLYVEACEAWHVLIAKNPQHFKPLVAILLECCKYDEDLDIVRYTFNFWYMLKQLLTLPNFKESKSQFEDIYTELIKVIIKHLMYPTDNNDDNLFGGDKEQEEKFKEFRYEMGDVLKDCCAVVGAVKSLDIPFREIESIMSQDHANAKWQNLEAPLFSMRAMAKEVPLTENTKLPTIMRFLIQLPEHPKIRYAATLVLGRYTEWTNKNPDFLEPQLNYIIKGFEVASNNNNRDIILAASHALMYFCHDCSKLLINYLEQLYLLYGQVREELDIDSTYKLVDGLAHVIKQIPNENLYQTLDMFCKPTLEKLSSLAVKGDSNNEELNVSIADQLEIITIYVSILRASEFNQPEYPAATYFIQQIWPIIQGLLQKFGASLKVSERLLKLLKHAIQSFSFYISPILSDIATTLHGGFKQTHYGCYLWVSGALIREFGDEYSTAETRLSVYDFGLTQSALFYDLVRYDQTVVNSMPDVIEDFFRMMNDLLMFYPLKLFSNLELLRSTLQASVVTMNSLEEFEPLISCLHFLIDFISWGLPHPPVSFFEEDHAAIQEALQQFIVLDNHGELLLKSVLEGVIFRFHPDIQHDANDLLLKILLVCPDTQLALLWLSNVVNALPNISEPEVKKLLSTVSVALPNKDNRRIRMSLRDFVSWYSRKNVNPRSAFA